MDRLNEKLDATLSILYSTYEAARTPRHQKIGNISMSVHPNKDREFVDVIGIQALLKCVYFQGETIVDMDYITTKLKEKGLIEFKQGVDEYENLYRLTDKGIEFYLQEGFVKNKAKEDKISELTIKKLQNEVEYYKDPRWWLGCLSGFATATIMLLGVYVQWLKK